MGTTTKEWSHATETVVLELDNTQDWQLYAMRLCRLEGVEDASITLPDWFESDVFPEGGDAFEEAARTLFLEDIDWVEVAIHFTRKSFEAYTAADDEEAEDIVVRAIEATWFSATDAVPIFEDDNWYVIVENREVFKVTDDPKGPACGLGFSKLEPLAEQRFLEEHWLSQSEDEGHPARHGRG